MKPTTEQLRDLLAKATQSEWSVCPCRARSLFRIECRAYNNDGFHLAEFTGPDRESNANLMVLAPTLAREVIELRDENKELVGLLRASLFLYDVPCADLSGSAQNIREDIVKALAKHGENNP